MNSVHLVGRLVRDVSVKQIAEDKWVTNNTIAVQRHKRSNSDLTADFIPVIAWGKLATVLQNHCQKGSLVGLSGHLQSRSYETDQQERRFVVEMVVTNIDLMSKKSEATT